MASSGETLLFDRSMYPEEKYGKKRFLNQQLSHFSIFLTGLHLHWVARPCLHSPFSLSTRITTTHSLRPMRMRLVDGADTSTRQLAEEDHALDVVVLQEADVGAHLGDGPHVHHHDILHLGEPVL